MRLRLAHLIILTSIPTCAQAAEQRYVLVWEDAFLHAAPRADAPRARAAAWPEGRAGRLGQVRVFERLAEQGDWVQVANTHDETPGVSDHCADPQWNLYDYRLRLWVKRSDLAPVLMKTVTTEFEDGTAVSIRAGAPVEPGEGPMLRVAADGRAVRLSLPDDMIGTAYRPARRLAADLPGGARKCPGGYLAKDAELTIAGKRPVARAHIGYPRTCLAKAEKIGQRHRVSLRSACLDLTAWTTKPPREEARGGGGVMGALSGTDKVLVKVRKGAQVRWPDGSPAGTTRQAVWFAPEQIEGDEPGCAEIPLTYHKDEGMPSEAEQFLPVCFDKADTQRARRPSLGDVLKGDLVETKSEKKTEGK